MGGRDLMVTKTEQKKETVLNELALFAGAGGGILGGHLLGWRTLCAVEWSTYAASILVARQNDGILPPFPVWNDVQTFDGRPWKGIVDVISGGFPCQDISVAGKGAGVDGKRSGMWAHMARIVDEIRPRHVFVENSPALTSRGLGRVLGDLAEMGYDARWGVLGAIDAGAPHIRERIWIVASDADSDQLRAKQKPRKECEGAPIVGSNGKKEHVADADSAGREEQRGGIAARAQHEAAECGGWWAAEPDVRRVDHGVAARVDRLKALGNRQVPAVAALAWRRLASTG